MHIGLSLGINNPVPRTTSGGVTPPLDDYTGAQTAWSVARKLRTAYSGSLIRVRRDSDNAEQDIGFDSNGNLDESALTTFVGAGSGYITTAYDQSGNGNDWTQATSTLQPRIVDTGTIEKVNGKPAAYCLNDKYIGFATGIITSHDASFFGVFKHSTTNACFFHADVSYWVGRLSSGVATNSYSNSGTPTTSVNNIEVGITQGDLFVAVDGNHVICSIVGATLDSGWANIETGFSSSSLVKSPDYMQETIIYFSDESANKSDINNLINDYYGIY